jgi:hypothetical protein
MKNELFISYFAFSDGDFGCRARQPRAAAKSDLTKPVLRLAKLILPFQQGRGEDGEEHIGICDEATRRARLLGQMRVSTLAQARSAYPTKLEGKRSEINAKAWTI